MQLQFKLPLKRWYRTAVPNLSEHRPLSKYKLKCGLEIHTQLDTRKKLFSQSTNDPFHSLERPNMHTSYFDIALPGTQPILNYEAVLYAIRLSLAIDAKVNLQSSFDRKHYFYGDQPMGYQITQHYRPFATGGQIKLNTDIDGVDDKNIRVIQLQLEQDTGKSVYKENEGLTLIDLNRSNVPLIEMVTHPDFTDVKQIRAFIKKYQNLVRHLNVSTGDLETGAMRVDVNLSVNDFARVELKNLPNTSSIINAIKFEFHRQVQIIEDGKGPELLLHPETRGWNGEATVKLRSKETTIDYRYMPDPELPVISLSPLAVEGVAKGLPPAPEDVIKKLMAAPYSLSLKDAKLLTIKGNSQDQMYTQPELLQFYVETFRCYLKDVKKSGDGKINYKLPTNWIIHELLGTLNKLQMPLKKVTVIMKPEKFSEFLMLIHRKEISNATGKLLLFHVVENLDLIKDKKTLDFASLIDEYDLGKISQIDDRELEKICQDIIVQIEDKKLIENIVSGKKKNSIKYLIGLGMRLSQGRISPQEFERMFKKLLGI
ncbi:hypothetical protein HG536_0B04600 [Torulaspora globosa]|uniref:Glutamyl-tRNA(Gln) amidotransferase subunit B, mitochondrial n=1 Tax=Torulaspora globosa TaxID=48254 RepID=A0A7G3ZDL0_9SACH|nr:uncharacterized protein HG536_0B04600 [Torulaspora globosa]QLL31596.1 hypothetical protein HG536_0B04600 [Torulaspora globosa]